MKALNKAAEEIATLNDIIEQTFYLEQKIHEWKQKVESNKKYISKALGRKNSLDARIDENTSFNVQKKIDTKLHFFYEQLQKTLDKKTYNKVINKTVTIDDVNALIKTLKWYGVPPKEFKTYITVHHEVDIEKVDSLIEIGEISIDEIQGCYSVEFNEDIRVRKTK